LFVISSFVVVVVLGGGFEVRKAAEASDSLMAMAIKFASALSHSGALARLADTIFCRVLQDVHINEVI
jgi:hypothetical protein